MRFSKYHALGNDYIVIEPGELPSSLTPGQIRIICHRNFGVGSDGVLLGPLPSHQARFALRIFNPDGSEAEKSGNGLRIFSRYLWDRKVVGEDEFTVETSGGVVKSRVLDGGQRVRIEMGRVTFWSDAIPVTGARREVINEQLVVSGRTFTFCAASVGNPHCVLPLEEISPELARQWGPSIEAHPLFPNRTNVQFLKVLDRRNIRIEIWERGAGYTLASGSSSSAAAAVAHKLGFCDRSITVHMPGGVLSMEMDDRFDVVMTGPVTRVMEGTVSTDMFAASIPI